MPPSRARRRSTPGGSPRHPGGCSPGARPGGRGAARCPWRRARSTRPVTASTRRPARSRKARAPSSSRPVSTWAPSARSTARGACGCGRAGRPSAGRRPRPESWRAASIAARGAVLSWRSRRTAACGCWARPPRRHRCRTRAAAAGWSWGGARARHRKLWRWRRARASSWPPARRGRCSPAVGASRWAWRRSRCANALLCFVREC